jgi:hypothetical protein
MFMELPAYVAVHRSSSCGKAVDEACNSCGSPDTRLIFGRPSIAGFRPESIVHAFSCVASLEPIWVVRTIWNVPKNTNECIIRLPVTTALHRFEESIGGRPYLIEVAAVSKDRWRACIVRIPGVPTALMPFYGETPEAAAGNLLQWLTRAYERASNGVARV